MLAVPLPKESPSHQGNRKQPLCTMLEHTLLIIPRAENFGHINSHTALISSTKLDTDESSQNYIIFNTGIRSKDHTSLIKEENVESWFGKKLAVVLEKIDEKEGENISSERRSQSGTQSETLCSFTNQNDTSSTVADFLNDSSFLQPTIKIEKDLLCDEDSQGLHEFKEEMDWESIQESGADIDNEFSHFPCSELVSGKLIIDEPSHESIVENNERELDLPEKFEKKKIRRKIKIYSLKKSRERKARRRRKNQKTEILDPSRPGEIILSCSPSEVFMSENRAPPTESMNGNLNYAMFDSSSNLESSFTHNDEVEDTVRLPTETIYLHENLNIKEEESSERESCVSDLDSDNEKIMTDKPSASYDVETGSQNAMHPKPEHLTETSLLRNLLQNFSQLECSHCKKKFLMKHSKMQIRDDPFICVQCNLKLACPSLKRAKPAGRKGLEKVKGLECSFCKKKYLRQCSLDEHLRIHTGIKPFECNICKVKFARKMVLKRHMRTHSLETTFQCSHCNDIFGTKQLLNHHKSMQCLKTSTASVCDATFHKEKTRENANENPHACVFCQETFQKKSMLEDHLKTHLEKYPCTVCNLKYPTKVSLQAHVKTHPGVGLYKCLYCNLKFSEKQYLVRHNRSHTGVNSFRSSTGKSIIMCTVCSATFREESELRVHKCTHLQKSPQESETSFTCVFCNWKFFEVHTLNDHLRTHLEKFHCPHCNVKLATKAALTEHMEVHPEEKLKLLSEGVKVSDNPNVCSWQAEVAFACVFCNLKFSEECSFDNHLKIHLDKFPCIHCNLKFTTKAALDEHTKLHFEINPDELVSSNETLKTSSSAKSNACPVLAKGLLECVFCSRNFSETASLNEHLKMHLNKFPCVLCNLHFPTKAALAKHIKTHSEVSKT